MKLFPKIKAKFFYFSREFSDHVIKVRFIFLLFFFIIWDGQSKKGDIKQLINTSVDKIDALSKCKNHR